MTDEIICIFCAERKKRSREHLIPKSLGGNIVTNHVCRDCNSILGRIADSQFETNSYIAAAYKKIGWEGKLVDLMKKAEITAIDMSSLISMKLKIRAKDEFRIIPQDLEDGSLIVGEEDSVAVISKMIDRRKEEYVEKGLSEQEIEDNKKALLGAYEKADPDAELDCPELGLKLVKHSSDLEKKVEYSKNIPLRGISKIAYELFFFVAGHRCLDDRYEAYRKYSLGGERIPLVYQLFRSDREITFSPIHQLYFIELNLEDDTKGVLVRTDSEKWKMVGSIG
jgi:hypothetical protein